MTKFERRNSEDAHQWMLAREKIYRPLVVKTMTQAALNPSETVKGFHVCSGDSGRTAVLIVMECRDRTPLSFYVVGFEGIQTRVELTGALAYLDNCIRTLSEGKELSTMDHDSLADL